MQPRKRLSKRPSGVSKSSQGTHLDHVERRDGRIAHLKHSPEHRVVLTEAMVPCDLQKAIDALVESTRGGGGGGGGGFLS